jgi:hypothetical protein
MYRHCNPDGRKLSLGTTQHWLIAMNEAIADASGRI